jgi:uncharacterized protein (TIGR03435 family)
MRYVSLFVSTMTMLAAVVVPLAAQPAFEVASIRASDPITDQGVTAGVHIDGAQVHCVLLSLRDYIGWAYKVKDYQIEGPAWMASARFDITAKVPAGATQEQVAAMMGALLAERFGMKMHRESKESPVYGLVVAKGGSKLKASPADPPAADGADRPEAGKTVNVVAQSNATGTVVDLGQGSSVSILYTESRLEGRKVAMAGLADVLARFADRPVVDMTGIEGVYDFTLQFTPEDFQTMLIRAAVVAGAPLPPEALKLLDNTSGDSAFAVLETLGLKMEPRKAPLDLVVIDHMEKAPSDN